MKEYPKGTQFGNYYLTYEADRPCIRRQITLPDGSRIQPRYPRHKYSHLQKKAELLQLINRLNYRADARSRRAIEVKTAFIPSVLLEEFRAQLKLEIPTEKDFRYQYKTVLHSYFLNFFVTKLGLLDPNQWHQNQSKWGAALLGESDNPDHNVFDKEKMSHKTITRAIQIANRFMAFLHLKNPEEYKSYYFEPISRAALKNYSAKLKLKKKSKGGIGNFISPEDWAVISDNLPETISPFIRLMYHYGLRRSESLGFDTPEAVKKGYLRISQQLVTVQSPYQPVKSRFERSTPHWFCKPIDAYNWIMVGLERKMHPDTLSEQLDELMADLFQQKKIKIQYQSHDFRRTFITRALRLYNHRDVQLAVGHASLATTMAYAMDDRDHSDETFNPTAS